MKNELKKKQSKLMFQENDKNVPEYEKLDMDELTDTNENVNFFHFI